MAPLFTFDEDMDEIWEHCCSLAKSHHRATNNASELVKPWHLALQLLYGDVSEETDHRLDPKGPMLSVTKSLELPLLWTAITRMSTIDDRLDVHLLGSVGRVKASRYLQQLIGNEFWKEMKAEQQVMEPAAQSGDEEDPILNYATGKTEAVLRRAKRLSDEYVSDFVAPQHVLLALLEDNAIKGVLRKYRALNVDGLPDTIHKLRPMRVSGHRRPPLFPVLNKYASDLTQTIIDKKKDSKPIDPLIGRTAELRRLISILSKYKKNSAVLLGDPGVGKTAIAEALAHRIINLEVPESVIARVFSLDLTSILATTQCSLSYEQIVMDILQEVADHEIRGIRAILFFDNMSQVTIGGYREDGSGLDAASIMKRFFAQGTLRCVGCSTVEDYRDHIEKDGALARRFAQIMVCECSSEAATDVLRGLKPSLEDFHRVRITDAAFKIATSIATQYFSHKRLPDAALDLIDEACVSVSLARYHTAEEIWRLQRKRVVMEIEIRSLERQLDEESEQRLADRRYDLARLDDKIEDFSSSRRYRKRLRQELKNNSERKKTALQELQASVREDKADLIDLIGDLDIDARELERRLEAIDSGDMTVIPNEAERVHEADPVTVREVAVTASYYTFIPAARGGDLGDISKIDTTLSGVVVGQPKAIDVMSGVMRSLWAGLKNPRRPVASILFGGPSGSGKTLLVKELAKLATRQSGRLVTINASDYTLPHTITRLIGTPTCTGYDQGGQLTECVRRKPFSVVYIKEVERGCEEFRMFIQTILDEGTARDGDGQVVNFTNCVIILSTALGRENAPRSRSEGQQRRHYEQEIHQHLPEEFLARIDDIVIFQPITGQTLIAMVEARLQELKRQLAAINLKLNISCRAQDHILAMLAQQRVRSAQVMERWIRSQVIQPLTSKLLKEDPLQNGMVELDVDDFNRLTVDLQAREESRPASPASSYHSFDSFDGYEAYSDTESVSSEDDHKPSFAYDPISVVRSGLQVQPQRIF